MSNTTLSPYMLLVLPIPEVEVGPDWAQELITALGLRIDQHDHTADNGVRITPAGMLINMDLSFEGFSATNLKSGVLQSQGSTIATPGSVYRVGNDLYYTNGAGVPVKITSGSAVVSPGSGALVASTPGAYPYSVLASDAQKVLLVNTTVARTLNLPAATNAMYVIVKDISGLSQTNNISVVPNGTDTIDGLNATYLIREDYSARGFISDGVSAWYAV